MLQYLERDTLSVTIYDLLYRLGATANYTGFFYVVHAVRLSVADSGRLQLVTKWLYPDVAKYCGTSWQAVERGIRKVIDIVWEANRELLCEIAGGALTKKPGPSRFLSLLTEEIQRDRAS